MNDNNVYEKILEKVQMPNSRWIPIILKKLITPDEGRILLEMPLTVADYSEKYQVSADRRGHRNSSACCAC